MRPLGMAMVLMLPLAAGCAARQETVQAGSTLAELHDVSPDLQDAEVDRSLDQAMKSYRRFLEETPETQMTPEAMRRLADLELEKEFGIRGGDGNPREMAAPEPAALRVEVQGAAAVTAPLEPWGSLRESEADFESRTTAGDGTLGGGITGAWMPGPERTGEGPKGPLEAIALYDRLLKEYPDYEHRDQVLYQMARAYDELGRTEEALETMERLIQANPYSEHYDEVQFRRGEHFFMRKRYRDAETAYAQVIGLGPASSYYELALYKLGWTLYKQEFYEEALHRYIALLDHKVSLGYDFDQEHAEEDERRVADTYRVISLSFNNLGGAEFVQEYFSTYGNRPYEDRVYANLGEHYLAKLRYDDAARTYRSFVTLYPFHRSAPDFGMRLVETFTKGGFPKLVLESKREFASKYGLQAEYWRHFDPGQRPEVMAYLKGNLKDLATHYHALYQSSEDDGERLANYHEAIRWYGDYLASFPEDAETPQINYRLADLHLENEDFGEAARQYERTAYEYPPHDRSADAGYAAVYAHREQLKAVPGDQKDPVKRETVASSLRFADTFPAHEHAPEILGAAATDLFELKSYGESVGSAQRLIDTYPEATEPIRRSAWLVVAHGSFELAEYERAEKAYVQVLSSTPDGDEDRDGLVDNLAASIYKQGELAREAEDYRSAADHFLRIRSAAPASSIRATAEYDAGAALMELEEWSEAAGVLKVFRKLYPEHELHLEATRQIAYAYRESGRLMLAAEEYSRLADESEDPGMRGEALLVAGELYEESDAREQALGAYSSYVQEFPEPAEEALETRFKIAEIHEAELNEWIYHRELAEIVRIEAEAGAQRTRRTRTIAARSALVLAEQLYRDCVAIRLLQPFETSLKAKKERMDSTIAAMKSLVSYEIADVTAAATYYMAETYLDFSRALMESERPSDLDPSKLQEYEVVLEEEAFPFEEKAIDLHVKNLEMLQAGVMDQWTEKSLAMLVDLVPGRYAKSEVSAGFLERMDGYAYQTPVWQFMGPLRASEGGARQASSVQAVSLGNAGADGRKDDNAISDR